MRDLVMGDRRAPLTAALGDPPPPGPSPVETRIAADRATRDASPWVPRWVTRDEALTDSVVNRARDLVCGTFARLPFKRTRSYAGVDEDLGSGWLDRPDPDHSRGWFVAGITDDLFFRGYAYAQVTSRDFAGYPDALRWLKFDNLIPATDGRGVRYFDDGSDTLPGLGSVPSAVDVVIPRRDLVVFECALDGVLTHGAAVLDTSSRLAASANRFAGAELAAGWLKQTSGEPLSADEANVLVAQWADARRRSSVGYLNESVEYAESQLQPDSLQLVEGRSYQDNAVARICNLPSYAVNASVPGDSMTYKTAATARLDVLDFGLAPFAAAWAQTLSAPDVTPRGTTVEFDLDPFLRTAQLNALREPTNPPSSGSATT